MAVTPNFSWPVPVATDYVKDGWEAISDLGNAIDTTVAALPSGALTKIVSTSFTAQSTIDFTGCFSSTYANYKLFYYLTAASVDSTMRFRMLSGSTPNTAASYAFAVGGLQTNGTTNNGSSTGTSGAVLTDFSSTDADIVSGEYTFYKPNIAKYTSFTGTAIMRYGGVVYSRYGGGYHGVQTAYDGLRLYTDSGTITGVATIYGVQN